MDLSAEVHKLEQDLVKLKSQQGGVGGFVFNHITDFVLRNTFKVSGSTNYGVIIFEYQVEHSPHPHTMIKVDSVLIDGNAVDFSAYTDLEEHTEGIPGSSTHTMTITGVADGTHEFVVRGAFFSDLTTGVLRFKGKNTSGSTIELFSE